MDTERPSLNFSLLQRRLLEQVRIRLCNGEFTERRLARMIGISQPHMHNVLKGVRSLTPEVADLLFGGLCLSVLDLIETQEAGALLEERQDRDGRSPFAPVASSLLGPGHPIPRLDEAVEWRRIPARLWKGRQRLALAPLSPDPQSPLPASHDFVLLCLDEDARLRIHPGHFYVLRWRGTAYVRRVRVQDKTLVVLKHSNWLLPEGPEEIGLEGQSVLSVIRATVLWSGADFRRASPLDYMGKFLE